MNIELLSSIKEVSTLLAECSLPVSDISATDPLQFFGIREGGALAAAVGLELYPPVGLLRSLAVHSGCRNRGFARELVSFAESFSAARGVTTLYLLTTTADQFFISLGYSAATRGSAPPAIQATTQFSGICPASSAFLSKYLGSQGRTLPPGLIPGKTKTPPG